jgi:hypothetical protein
VLRGKNGKAAETAGFSQRRLEVAWQVLRHSLERAMAIAMLYPEPEKGGRGKKRFAKLEGFSHDRLSQARQVLRHSVELANAVRDHTITLDAALATVKAEQREKRKVIGIRWVFSNTAPRSPASELVVKNPAIHSVNYPRPLSYACRGYLRQGIREFYPIIAVTGPDCRGYSGQTSRRHEVLSFTPKAQRQVCRKRWWHRYRPAWTPPSTRMFSPVTNVAFWR